MSEDMNIINQLKQLSTIMDTFVKQRNSCNKTMNMVANELEKIDIFVKKLSLHINECKGHSKTHTKLVSELLSKERERDIDDDSISDIGGNMDSLNSGLEDSVDSIVEDYTYFTNKFSKNLLKLINSKELKKDELKKRLRALHKYHNKKSKSHVNELSGAIDSLRNTRESQVSVLKTGNKDVIKSAIKKEKSKFADMLSSELDKYSQEQDREMVDVDEVLDAIKEAVSDLDKNSKKDTLGSIKKDIEKTKKDKDDDVIKNKILVTPIEDDEFLSQLIKPVKMSGGESLENKLNTILHGGKLLDGVITLKKRKKRAGKSMKKRNGKKRQRKTVKLFFTQKNN